MQSSLPAVVGVMRDHMVRLQTDFAAHSEVRLASTLKNLAELQDRQIRQLELRLEGQIEAVKRGRFERRSQDITRVFDSYRQWVQDSLTTEPQPWIQVMAAICHPAAGA